jgi:tRNA-dihydrouridine synthase 3
LLHGDVPRHLRFNAEEHPVALQLGGSEPGDLAKAAKIGQDWGYDEINLNCGCPIYEATRRNLGSSLLRHPDKLARLVRGITAGSPLPLSVKVRMAAEGGEINVREVVSQLRDAGAAAVTIHGRTATDRYSKAADWKVIAQVVEDGVLSAHEAMRPVVPVLGNGDILTYYEARERIELSGVHGVMVGRGALTKPWIFQEFAEGRAWEPTAAERIGVYRRLACYMKEHFGDDARGRLADRAALHQPAAARVRRRAAGLARQPRARAGRRPPGNSACRERRRAAAPHALAPRESLIRITTTSLSAKVLSLNPSITTDFVY